MADRREDRVIGDDELRRLYAGALAERGGRGAGCPPPEAIQALVRREGSEETRLGTLDHVMGCAACRPEYDLLRSVEGAGRKLGAGGRTARPRWLMPAALAASVLVAIGVVRLALSPGEDVVFRDAGAGAVTLLTPRSEARAGAPVLFAWRPVPGARRYRLEVLTAAGEVAFETETVDTLVAPESARALAPGEYQWWVSTVGSPERRSELRRLSLLTP